MRIYKRWVRKPPFRVIIRQFLTRHPQDSPAQNVQHSLELPLFDCFDQSRSDGIFAHIQPFLRIAFRPAQPSVPMSRLPSPLRSARSLSEESLPIRNPSIQWHFNIGRSTEKMRVIWHQYVIANEPRLSFIPSGSQMIVSLGARKPGPPVFRADGQKHNCRLPKINSNTRSRP